MTSKTGKILLLDRGIQRMKEFCELNEWLTPEVKVYPRKDWRFSPCAYYRPTKIHICLEKCAAVGRAGRMWSYPGYKVDRTPFGVVAHELGHHAEHLYPGLAGVVFKESGESSLTSYDPNLSEWLTEMFRLFVTNPDLLRGLRPRTFRSLRKRWEVVESRCWEEVLASAPLRTKMAAANQLRQEPLPF